VSIYSPVYVVAFDYAAFEKWCKRKGYDPTTRHLRYVRSVDTIRQLRSPVRFLFVDGWKARSDWRKIYNRALIIGERPK